METDGIQHCPDCSYGMDPHASGCCYGSTQPLLEKIKQQALAIQVLEKERDELKEEVERLEGIAGIDNHWDNYH